LDFPFGLAFDSSGNLYVANYGNYGNNTIMKFAPNGTGSLFASISSSGLVNPVGLAFDSSGNLYVACSGNNTIMKFTTSGTGSLFASSGLDEPRGLAFDSSGNLYVANSGNNTIEEFTPNGTGSLFASGGLDEPYFIAVEVPEPSIWAMLATGVGALFCVRCFGARGPKSSSQTYC
jgi:DNA-binding beta-propeller fold protein YncE